MQSISSWKIGSRGSQPAAVSIRQPTISHVDRRAGLLRIGRPRFQAVVCCAEYKQWARAQLTEELRTRYLPITGSKDVLVSRLEEDDELCAQGPPQKGRKTQNIALSIRNEGIVPPFNKVTKAQIVAELRRRGAEVSAKSKIELYEALEATVRASQGDSFVAETPDSTSEAKNFAQAMSLISNPAYEPASATVDELRSLLQVLKVPSEGSKAELLEQVNSYRSELQDMPKEPPSSGPGDPLGVGGDFDMGFSQGSSPRQLQSWGEGIVDNAAAEVASMSPYDVAAALEARGEVISPTSDPGAMKQRLIACLAREQQALSSPGVSSFPQDVQTDSGLLGSTFSPEGRGLGADIWGDNDGVQAEEGPGEEQESLGVWARPDMPPVALHSNTHMLLTQATPRIRVAVITGGPSGEASLSLESARTVVDALQTRLHPSQAAGLEATLEQEGYPEVYKEFDKHGISCDTYYVDSKLQAWLVPASMVYSRTPADFEFKLPETSLFLGDAAALAAHLRVSVDIAFPVVHGSFGEDGQLGAALREAGVPFVGSPPEASGVAFNKITSRLALLEAGFPALEQTGFVAEDFEDLSCESQKCKLTDVGQEKVDAWIEESGMDAESGAVVLKPAEEGSSINVRFAFGMQDAIEHAHDLLANEDARLVVMEPKVLGAIEFSVCVLQTPSNVVIALPPTSMEIVDLNSDIQDHLNDVEFGLAEQQQGQGIERVHLFDDEDPQATFVSYNRKYQPNNEIRTHTPAKLPINAVQAIRRTAERAFLDLGLRDYARFDGWIMLHSEQQHMKMLTDLMLDDGTPPTTHQNTELPLPGFGPLPEEEFLQDGVFDITEEQLAELEPEFESEPLDEYIYSPAHDRFFTPEQLEYAKGLEADAIESEELQQQVYAEQFDTRDIGLPQQAIPAARGDDSASFQPVTTPIDAMQKPINELVQFEGGMVIIGDVNPCTGLEQGSLMFMQGAAVGWSHAGVLRHIVAGALRRARLRPLPPPVEPIARNPEVLSQGEDLPGSVLAQFTNTTQEMQDVHGDEWPSTFADEDGGSGGASDWRQPGSILEPETDETQDTQASSTVNGVAKRPLAALSEMVTRGNENHFEEIEDEAFEGLIDHWDVEESGEEGEGADSADPDTDAQDADAAEDQTEVTAEDQKFVEESWASLRERATLQGVCANDLHYQDLDRIAHEIAQELPIDALKSEDQVTKEQALELLTSTRGNPMAASSRIDMMEDLREDDPSGSEPQEEEAPRIGEEGTAGERQKVYVLCGGDSSERQVSLQSGVTAWLQLRRYHDIEVTLYVLVPHWSSLRERRRRLDMLHQRTHFLLNGLEEDNLPAGLTLDEIRRPRMDNLPPIEQRLVWAVPHALALRHSVEEVVEACELLAMTATTVQHSLPVGAIEGNQLRDQIQWELDALGLKGAGMMFEGLGSPHATSFDFETFAHHAQVNDAVVFNTIHGALGEDGTLQQYLSYYDIPYTGSPEAPSRICMNKLDTAECIGNMDTEDFFPIPKIELFLSDIAELCRSPHMAEAGLAGMREDLVVHDTMPLVIKPAADGCSTGVFLIQEPEHLLTYAFAVGQEWDEIPIELTAGGTDPIVMPADISNSYIVEPYISTDTVKFHRTPISEVEHDATYKAAVKIANDILPHVEDGHIKDQQSTHASASQYLLNAVDQGELLRPVPGTGLEDCETEDADSEDENEATVDEDTETKEVPFPLVHNVVTNASVARLSKEEAEGLVEVTIGVYGPMGEMTAMTPSMTLKEGGVLSLGEKFATGHGVSLTPPPDHIVPKESVQAARKHAETIANNLGLVGFARIDAFMGVEDGTLFVIEINTVPGLAPNNVLFQQALQEDPPIYPGEFCRLQVLIARSQGGAIDTSVADASAQELSGYFDEDEIADAIADAEKAGQGLENIDEQETSEDDLSPTDQLEWAGRG